MWWAFQSWGKTIRVKSQGALDTILSLNHHEQLLLSFFFLLQFCLLPSQLSHLLNLPRVPLHQVGPHHHHHWIDCSFLSCLWWWARVMRPQVTQNALPEFMWELPRMLYLRSCDLRKRDSILPASLCIRLSLVLLFQEHWNSKLHISQMKTTTWKDTLVLEKEKLPNGHFTFFEH